MTPKPGRCGTCNSDDPGERWTETCPCEPGCPGTWTCDNDAFHAPAQRGKEQLGSSGYLVVIPPAKPLEDVEGLRDDPAGPMSAQNLLDSPPTSPHVPSRTEEPR